MCGDAQLLFQVFSNLISNAIKYSPEGGEIKIHASQTAEATSVVIRDHGLGIPDQDRAQIFTRHYRGSNVTAMHGTGVGLFLVATVVRLHGGDISVESAEGHGSRFTVVLPNDFLSGQMQAEAHTPRRPLQ